MTVESEMRTMWKEAAVAYFIIGLLSQNVLGETKVKKEKHQSGLPTSG
jgi:hypothetical protein